MTLVKICGLTHAEDVDLCIAAGVARFGVVVEYPVDVPWNLTRDAARALMQRVPADRVAVAVVGGDAGHILALVRHLRPTMVQLHGDEPPQVVAAVAAEGVPVIKAIRVFSDGPPVSAEALIAAAAEAVAAGAAEILLDAANAERPAGTGQRLDWALAAQVAHALPVPLILAGGLTPQNVADAVAAVRPDGVDVITGVETSGHRKSAARVRAFTRAAVMRGR